MLRAYSLLPHGLRSWLWRTNLGSRAYWIGLALLVVVLSLALYKAYREWQEIHDVEEPDTPDDLLRSFREAHAMGELDDEEMRRVEQRLSAGPAPPSSRGGETTTAPTQVSGLERSAVGKPGGERSSTVSSPEKSDVEPAQSDGDRA
jgi:uncharacterized membrane protein